MALGRQSSNERVPRIIRASFEISKSNESQRAYWHHFLSKTKT